MSLVGGGGGRRSGHTPDTVSPPEAYPAHFSATLVGRWLLAPCSHWHVSP